MEDTQMADTNTTDSEPGFADLLELDLDRPAAKAAVAPVPFDDAPRPLDMIDDVKHPKCAECGAEGAVNDDGICRGCYDDRTVIPTSANPEQDFAGVIAESAANAGTVSGGSLAAGERRYVGFNSAEGYIQALANGVKAETAEQYKNTLVSNYGYTRAAVDQLPVNLITGSALPVGAGVQLHEGDTDEAVRLIKARQAAIRQAKAHKANNGGELTIVADDQPTKVRLTHGNVVAGAVAEGNGILTHWNGEGPLSRATVTELATAAGLDPSWLPKAKSAETQAHHAVTQVAREFKLDAKREKKTHKDAGAAYDARWRVTDPSTAGNDAGQSAGSIALVVTLNDGVLSFSGTTEIAEKIEATYKDLTGREVLQAGHVTSWLGNEVIRDRLGGVKYGGCWYVPAATRAAAEKIIAAFAPAWGTDWMNPPTPIATSEQLARGIANGLAAEVDDTLRELAKDGSKCRGGKVGETAAITYLRRFKDHGARALAFGHLLGEELVKEVKAKIATATEQLDGLIDDGMGTVKRFELIWEELERDLLKDAAKADSAEAAS